MNNLTRFWFSAQHHAPGVAGFRDIRCYLVMALYLGSFVCFASDPFFRQDGLFVYRQGLAAILLAFLVTSAWNWELNWFGRSRGANLLLQMLQMLPATLFFARVAGRASAPPKAIPANFFEGVLAKGRALLEQLVQLIPDWLSSPFANWRLTLLVLAVLAILSCRRRMLKSGALLLLLGGLAAATATGGAGNHFLGGLALFVAGMALQFHRDDRALFYAGFVRRILGSASLSEPAAAVLLRAAVLLDETGVLIERQLRRLVDDEYGPLGLSPEERDAILAAEPEIARWIRLYIGAEEFIKGQLRYCIWLKGASPADIAHSKTLYARVAAVKRFRLASKAKTTNGYAKVPHLFAQITQPDGVPFLLVPRVSSERRRYVPIGYMGADVIASDAVQILPNATLCHFGVLTSSVHMAWMRTVAGRLKSDYRYSKELVYNTFPWPEESHAKSAKDAKEDSAEALRTSRTSREKIESTAQRILDVRAKYPDCSFAELYDENLMPPDLRAAHVANDRAVLAAYGLAPDTPEPEIVAHLFKLYAGKNQMKQENEPCT